jgi:proline iminopeptidase
MLKRIKSKLLRVIILIFATILSLIIAFMLLAFIGGWISQRNTYTKPFLNKNGSILEGSIAEYKRLKIGGVNQAILIRGRNVDNPVLLFIHGGPGSGIIGQTKANAILEDYYTVVYWDQYGASKSYTPFMKDSHLTIEQFIRDGHELTQYIKKKLSKDKIVIIGHSWGSILGTYLAYQNPNDYLAFIGMGQVVNFKENEKGVFVYALNQAKNTNNSIAIEELNSINGFWNLSNKEVFYSAAIAHKWSVYYGGYFYGKNDLKSWYKDPFNDEFTISDAIPWLLGQSISAYKLFPELFHTVDLTSQVPDLKIPYYLLQGKSDYITPWYLSEKYFNQLNAPKKTLIWFDKSGHEPLAEEPEKFNQIMIDLRKSIEKNNLE